MMFPKSGKPHRNSRRAHAPKTSASIGHIGRVKELPCVVCGMGGPSDAHHLLEGRTPNTKVSDWLTLPLCKDCHQGSFNGIHGQRRIWHVLKKTELLCLADTLEKLYG